MTQQTTDKVMKLKKENSVCPTLYLGGQGLEFLRSDRLSRLMLSWSSLVSATSAGICHDRFLPTPFPVFTDHSIIRRYFICHAASFSRPLHVARVICGKCKKLPWPILRNYHGVRLKTLRAAEIGVRIIECGRDSYRRDSNYICCVVDRAS